MKWRGKNSLLDMYTFNLSVVVGVVGQCFTCLGFECVQERKKERERQINVSGDHVIPGMGFGLGSSSSRS
jgi:hypothetical protein